MHVFLPFATSWAYHPDYNAEDARREDSALCQRNQLLAEAWRGERPLDEALDALNDQGIDVDYYLAATIDNLDYVIRNKITLTDTDFLIPSSGIVIAQER
jgi:hypothetical protein